MSTELKTPEELAAESILDFLSADASITAKSIIVAALRKQAEQCRPYMQHKDGCGWVRDGAGYEPVNDCTCGLDAVLNAMK